MDHPKDFAVDGALYYAKYLKEYFNVIAVAISGAKKADIKVDAFYWAKNQTDYTELTKSKNIILEPPRYHLFNFSSLKISVFCYFIEK